MVRKALLVILLTTSALALAGCGPCGFGFNGFDTPLGCRSEPTPK